jgi:hypothetical protein
MVNITVQNEGQSTMGYYLATLVWNDLAALPIIINLGDGEKFPRYKLRRAIAAGKQASKQ